MKLSRWLTYAVLCIIAWGAWGFIAKLGADRIAPGPLKIWPRALEVSFL
jgi:hypothetical protein